MDTEDPKELVRRGYDALSRHYDQAYAGETKYQPWISELSVRIPTGATVLDLGCGSGVPMARALASEGHRVTGVDISEVQISRARQSVRQAEFIAPMPQPWTSVRPSSMRSSPSTH